MAGMNIGLDDPLQGHPAHLNSIDQSTGAVITGPSRGVIDIENAVDNRTSLRFRVLHDV